MKLTKNADEKILRRFERKQKSRAKLNWKRKPRPATTKPAALASPLQMPAPEAQISTNMPLKNSDAPNHIEIFVIVNSGENNPPAGRKLFGIIWPLICIVLTAISIFVPELRDLIFKLMEMVASFF